MITEPRTVCVVTGSRAEFGLLRWVMHEIQKRKALNLQLIVTGTHLVPAFGATETEILDEGFTIDRRVEIVLNSDTPVGVAKSYGLAVAGIAEALESLRPDVVLLLGDRYEIHAAAVAALLHRIPIAHIHGGEVTTGSLDDQFRHSITKLAQLHLTAHEDYRRRVIQMGEDPTRVDVVGGLGYESARRVLLLSRGEVEKRIGMTLQESNLLVVFHPVTAAADGGLSALEALCGELGQLQACGFVVSLPNADVGGHALRQRLIDFTESQPHAVALESMGQQLYLSCISHMSGIVGNSSSGLLEAPALGIPTLDIGIRQHGRRRPPSAIFAEGTSATIGKALTVLLSNRQKALSLQTKKSLAAVSSSNLICDALERMQISLIAPKQFVDLPIQF